MAEAGLAIRIKGLKKVYKLGQIGGITLQEELKRRWEIWRGRDDPDTKIGQTARLAGETFMALNGIDLEVHQGEALGIIGKNGAGKSTLLKILCQITAPTEGEIDINGRIASMLEVGIGFNGEMTGRENIYLSGAILGMTKAEIDRKMQDIIDFSEVEEFIDTPVKRYSSGMFVKLAFSVSAHLDSEILIMDEVLAVGDMDFQKKCLNKMREAANVQGRTVLYVSHNMNTIRRLCDRCLVLDEGKIIFDGDVDQAIAIYMGIEDHLKTEYHFTEDFRPYGRFSHKLSIEQLKILEAEEPSYPEDGTIHMEIGFTAAERLDTLRFRAELWFQDGTKVGSMLSGPIQIREAGQYSALLCMKLHGLMPGQYSADLVAYTADEKKKEEILDGVYPGLIFDLMENENADHHVEWSHQYWGHVCLGNMDLLLKEE